ncbi:MAG: anaerobic ribonucleoside-triphosphate reductase, partial [bacterium]
SMCCRLRLDNRELRKRGGGLFGANPLTGSLGVVTINLARIGYLSKTKEEFFSRLGALMDLAKQSLKLKRDILETFTEQGLYPYSRYYLKDIKERFGQYWKNHFNTIGLNGMNEALMNFMGKSINTDEGQELALEIMDFMLRRLGVYQEEDNQLYNLEATPAEGATYRFAKKDKELYPDIIVANNKAYIERGAAPYYTNSTHLPVSYSTDFFDVLEKQDKLQTKYTGGTVIHGFVGEKMPNIESTKNLVRKVAESFHLPYFTITPTFSICPKHGYIGGEHKYCPICDEEIGYFNEQKEKLAI